MMRTAAPQIHGEWEKGEQPTAMCGFRPLPKPARSVNVPRTSMPTMLTRYQAVSLQPAQFPLDKGADALDGAASLRQYARIKLEDMEHARPDFELDCRAGGAQPFSHAHGVV